MNQLGICVAIKRKVTGLYFYNLLGPKEESTNPHR